MNNFNVSDVVVLQSGGSAMTVTEIRSDGVVTTVWTDSEGGLQTLSVACACLFAVNR